MKAVFAILVLLILLNIGAAWRDERNTGTIQSAMGGDAEKGRQVMRYYGCSSCHTIPGVRGANALVGPPLDRMGSRMYIAGVLRNTPGNMVRWIQNPPGVDPLTAMPNLNVSDADARDIASYLYTLH